MSAGKWFVMFFGCLAAVLLTVPLLNLIVDPFGAFGDRFLNWYAFNMTNNPKVAKYTYIDARKGEFDAFILGPSGSSGLNPGLVARYTGYKCYNMFNYGADMAYTKKQARYLIENHAPKAIILVVPPVAAAQYDVPVTDITYRQPLRDGWQGPFVFANPKYALKKISDSFHKSYIQQPFAVFNAETGAYDKTRRDAEPIGSLSDYLKANPEFEAANYWHIGLPYIDECAKAVQEVASLCAANGVQLIVVVPPMLTEEIRQYDLGEVQRFYAALANVTDFYSFVNSPVSNDPRFFYDTTHYRNAVGDMMLAMIYGDETVYRPEGFGVYVTPQNALAAAETDFAAAPAAVAETRIAALMYHHLADDAGGNSMIVTPAVFAAQMQALADAGVTPVSISDIENYVRKGTPLPPNPVLITFDDGYASNYELAYPILKRLNFKATIFVIGVSFGADVYPGAAAPIIPHFGWDKAREMAASGLISIQSHTFDLHQNPLHVANPREGVLRKPGEAEAAYIAAFRADYAAESALITKAAGTPPTALAYPFGFHEPIAEILLNELGAQVTFTTNPAGNTLVPGLPASLLALSRYTIDDNTPPSEVIRLTITP